MGTIFTGKPITVFPSTSEQVDGDDIRVPVESHGATRLSHSQPSPDGGWTRMGPRLTVDTHS